MIHTLSIFWRGFVGGWINRLIQRILDIKIMFLDGGLLPEPLDTNTMKSTPIKPSWFRHGLRRTSIFIGIIWLFWSFLIISYAFTVAMSSIDICLLGLVLSPSKHMSSLSCIPLSFQLDLIDPCILNRLHKNILLLVSTHIIAINRVTVFFLLAYIIHILLNVMNLSSNPFHAHFILHLFNFHRNKLFYFVILWWFLKMLPP